MKAEIRVTVWREEREGKGENRDEREKNNGEKVIAFTKYFRAILTSVSVDELGFRTAKVYQCFSSFSALIKRNKAIATDQSSSIHVKSFAAILVVKTSYPLQTTKTPGVICLKVRA